MQMNRCKLSTWVGHNFTNVVSKLITKCIIDEDFSTCVSTIVCLLSYYSHKVQWFIMWLLVYAQIYWLCIGGSY
jgi:hypothetical protein